PAVVLETDERARGQAFDARQHDHVADEALLPRLRGHIDESDAVETLAVRGLVVVAEELVAPAHGEDLRAAADRVLQRLLLELLEVVVDQGLLAVLPAAEEEDVDVVHADDRSALQLHDPGLQPSPLGAAEQGEDVAAVAVDVHQVRVEPADGEPLGGAHVSQYGCAHPRLTSSARRSSIAV